MAFSIPVLDANDSLTEVVLTGETFFLHLGWNTESASWTLGINNALNEAVVEGIALVTDTPLLERYRASMHVPAGELVALTPDQRNSISRTALPLGIVALMYYEPDEVEALKNGTIYPCLSARSRPSRSSRHRNCAAYPHHVRHRKNRKR